MFVSAHLNQQFKQVANIFFLSDDKNKIEHNMNFISKINSRYLNNRQVITY